MKRIQWLKRAAIAWACVSVSFGGIVRGAQPTAPAPGDAKAARIPAAAAMADVALTDRNALEGQVLSVDGQPLSGVGVQAVQNGRVVANTLTDGQGWFSMPGMRGGVYRLETDQGVELVRAWTEFSAPPAARPHVMIVHDGDLVRGQGAMRRIICNPWFWGVGIATAIAVPVAIAASDDDDKKKGS